jgi:carbon-monoxide dehydrogenase small subunit
MNARKQAMTLTLNGEPVDVLVRPYETLLDTLRETLGLTGPKEGCGTGDCGACTVHLDGKAVASCLVLALQARNRTVVTIEGLGAATRCTRCRTPSCVTACRSAGSASPACSWPRPRC